MLTDAEAPHSGETILIESQTPLSNPWSVDTFRPSINIFGLFK
jgi:hypothetical protein